MSDETKKDSKQDESFIDKIFSPKSKDAEAFNKLSERLQSIQEKLLDYEEILGDIKSQQTGVTGALESVQENSDAIIKEMQELKTVTQDNQNAEKQKLAEVYGKQIAFLQEELRKANERISELNKNLGDEKADSEMKKKELEKKVDKLKDEKKELEEKIERLKEDKDSLKVNLEETKSSLESQIKDLKGDKESLTETKRFLESQIEDLKGDKKTLTEIKGSLEGQIADLEIDKRNLNETKVSLENANEDLQGKISNLLSIKQTLEKGNAVLEDKVAAVEDAMEIQKRDLSSQLDDAMQNIQNLFVKKEELEDRLQDCQQALAESKLKANNLDVALSELQDEKDQLEDTLKDRSEKLDQTAATLKVWEDLGKVYAPALKAVQQYSGFTVLLPKLGLVGDDISTLFKFITLIGRNLSFAGVVAKQIKAIKKDQINKQGVDSCFMDETERKLYIALNNCYKQTYGKDFEVFRYPGNQSLTGNYAVAKFNPNEVENLPDPGKKSLTYDKGIYVPVIYNPDNGNIALLGQVKAGNN